MPAAGPLTAMVKTTEIGMLRRLHGMLEFDPINSREQFGDLMKAAFDHCSLDARRLSDDLGYSFSAVYRWIEGRTAPHKSLWPRIVEWVMQALEERIAEAEKQEAVCA